MKNILISFLEDIRIDLQKSETCNIQIIITVNFTSSEYTKEEYTMHLKIDNIKVMNDDSPDEIIEELFDWLLYRYQISWETQMREILSSIVLTYFITNVIKWTLSLAVHTLILWTGKKKATVNPKNDDGKYFQYATTIALNHDKM